MNKRSETLIIDTCPISIQFSSSQKMYTSMLTTEFEKVAFKDFVLGCFKHVMSIFQLMVLQKMEDRETRRVAKVIGIITRQ